MVTSIDRLTPAQEEQIPEWNRKWLQIGLSTKPADFDAAEEAVKAIYRYNKHPEPKMILRAASPKDGLNQIYELGAKHGYTNKDELKRSYINSRMFGQYYVSVVAYVTFYRDVCDLEFSMKDLSYLEETLAKSCCAVHWFDDVAVIIDRPKKFLTDQGGTLHNDEGKALEFRDGTGLYAWHSYILAPEYGKYIDDKKLLTSDIIDRENNIELRRVLLEVYGFDNYLANKKAKVIDEDELHGFPRRLLEFEVGKSSPITVRVIEVHNGSLEADGSRRKFLIGAVRHPTTREFPKTAAEAVAWSYGRPAKKYKEQVRT